MRIAANWENHLTTKCDHISIITVTFGAICQQGYNIPLNLPSGRFIIIVMLWVSIIVYHFYTSVLVSTLIGTVEESPIRNLKLLGESDVPVALDNNSFVRNFVEVSKYRIL